MKFILKLMIFIVIAAFFAGCSMTRMNTSTDEPINENQVDEAHETEEPSAEQSSAGKTDSDSPLKPGDEASPVSKPESSEHGRSNQDDLDVPEKYIRYLSEHYPDVVEEIVIYLESDIDNDGRTEAIIAKGVLDDQDETSSYIPSIYILRDNHGEIELIEENLSGGGYGVYELKLIQLQNNPKKYIYCGLTNGVSLRGFTIVELANNRINTVCYTASPTGAGDDVLADFNKDGQYDGFTQYRWSYDTLYYSVVRTYLYDGSNFVHDNSQVDIPEYPNNAKDAVMQYLTLTALNEENSSAVNERLSALCKFDYASNFISAGDILYNAVYNTIMEFEGAIEFESKEDNESAEVSIRFTSEDQKVHKYLFQLTKLNNAWSITEIMFQN